MKILTNFLIFFQLHWFRGTRYQQILPGNTMQELIELGAITFLVPGNLPIGCSPSYLTYFQGSDKAEYDPLTGCITWLNQFTEYHNELLQKELDRIRELHPHVNIVYADYYNAAMRFYHSPKQFGTFTFLKKQ